MKKIIVLVLMILLSGNLMANANTKVGGKSYPLTQAIDVEDLTDGMGAPVISDVDTAIVDDVKISLEFAEATALTTGTKLAAGATAAEGTVAVTNLTALRTKGSTLFTTTIGMESTISGTIKVVTATPNGVVVKYNILIKKANVNDGTTDTAKNVRISGTAFIPTA